MAILLHGVIYRAAAGIRVLGYSRIYHSQTRCHVMKKLKRKIVITCIFLSIIHVNFGCSKELSLNFYQSTKRLKVWIQIRTNILSVMISHDLGPNCLQRLSADDKNGH